MPDVLESGEALIVDFGSEREKLDRARLPYYLNFRLNSRFGFRTPGNALLVPIVIGSGSEKGSSKGEAVGVIRLLNCFEPVAGWTFRLTDPGPLLEELRLVADRVALMYRNMLSAVHRQILGFAVQNLGRPSTLAGFLDLVMTQVVTLLDFDHVAVWVPHEDRRNFASAYYRGIGGIESLGGDRSYPALAFERCETIDIAAERRLQLPRGRGTGQDVSGPAVQNGFEIPIVVGRKPLGSVGFYDSWAAGEGGPYTADLRALCENLASLIGVKMSLGEGTG